MDVSTVQGMIAGLGFPIACVVGLAFFGYKVWIRSAEQNEKREERSYTMMGKFQASLDSFSNVLEQQNTKLTKLDSIDTRMGKVEDDIAVIKENTKK